MAGGVFSTAKLHAMTVRESATDGSDFTNPDADYRRLFLGEDGFLHVKDSAGAVTDPYPGGGGLTAGRVLLTTSDLTTTSTTFVDATGISVTITTGAHSCLIAVSAVTEISAVPNDICLDIDVDGARIGGSFGVCSFQHVTAARRANQAFSVSTATLTAASHTFKLQWRVVGGTGTLYRSTTIPLSMTVIEMPV